jgi:demethylmenaquinone methyltransferase/2-methoxy-6-polyprenyl-1,4-benzoquinol methylase
VSDARRRVELVERFFAGTGSSYERVVRLATFGIDGLWKRRIVAAIPGGARRILDLACGTGILTFAIARHFPRAQVVGVELRAEYLERARRRARRRGVNNVQFFQGRAEDYASREPFDAVVSSYLAKYAELELLTRNTRDMLETGGLLLMHDFTYPPKAYLVPVWRLYFKLLQGLGTPLLPAWREIFYGLPGLIEETRWLEELTAALAANAFRDVRTRYLTLYGSAVVTARK